MEEGEHCGGSGEDRISGLPDELLHDILVRLRSAQAAARTSVLSRRWRHVWAHLPELHLVAPRAAAGAPSTFLDTVDGALAGYMAPTLGHLSIFLDEHDVSITAGRLARWLRFAAEHMAAEIQLCLPRNPTRFSPTQPEVIEDEKVLELPAWEGAKQIALSPTPTEVWRVRPQASGLFKELTSLKIFFARMGGAELTALVCTQCPCLTDLDLDLDLIAISDVSLHSNSLRSLGLHITYTRRLEVVAPNLEKLGVYCQPVEAHISAPKLVRVAWHCAYDPHLHRIADVGRSLRLLQTNERSAVLTKQFDEVDELKLVISIGLGGETGYGTFLNQTNKLPKCKSIDIRLWHGIHAFFPVVLHLLRNCSSTKKFSVRLHDSWTRASGYSCPASCSACGLEESRNIDAVALNSLEEIEISEFTDSLESMELVEFLTRNAAILKRLVINYTTRLRRAPPLTKEICEKIRSMCRRNVKVKFHVFRDAKLVPFD